MSTSDSKMLLTVKEAAERLAICPRTLFSWTKDGEVAAVRVGKRGVRYLLSDLEKYVASRRQAGIE